MRGGSARIVERWWGEVLGGGAGDSAGRAFEIRLETIWDTGRDSRHFFLKLFGQAGDTAARAFEFRLETTWDTGRDSRQCFSGAFWSGR